MFTYQLFFDSCLYGSNSLHSMLDFHKKNIALIWKKYQGILPTNMLACLVIHIIFITDVLTEYIANKECQIHHIYLDQCSIQ